MWKGDMASFMLHWLHEWNHLYEPASISCNYFPLLESYWYTIVLGLLWIVFQCFSLRFTYKQCHVTASLLAHEEWFRLSSEGADIRSKNVPTFTAFRFLRFLQCGIAGGGAAPIRPGLPVPSGLCFGWSWHLLLLVRCCAKGQPL